jgi:AhpD family alkylhydroperoxidase
VSRLDGPPRGASPLVRAALRSARRTIRKLAGSDPERGMEPMEAFARAPRMLYGYCALELAAAKPRHIEREMVELVAIRAAMLLGCEYCLDIGSEIGRRMGLSDEQLRALPRHRESGRFSERQNLALELAGAMTRTPAAVSDELYDRLVGEFSEPGVVELATVIGLENLRSRFNLTFEIGSAGFSEGRVCALPDRGADGALSAAG